MRRGVALENRCRLLEAKLSEATVMVPQLVASLTARDDVIARLQREVRELRHALDVAQGRIWQPSSPPRPSLVVPPTDVTSPTAMPTATPGVQARVVKCSFRLFTAPTQGLPGRVVRCALTAAASREAGTPSAARGYKHGTASRFIAAA